MSPTRPQAAVASGERVLNGRYRLLEVLGSGGMGTVHRAFDLRLGRPVAVKLLRTDVQDGAEHRRRLEAEATIAASLRHPSIAQVYDHDEDRDAPDRTPFVVMELVEGVTLARLLRDRGALPWEETLAIVREVASALDHLETHGVVHRDLKPANIMLTTDARAVLVDFGIARGGTSTALTNTGSLLGTVEYLSPEQIGGASATTSSDLYALGVVAHGCLTGTSPFRRDSHIATAWAQVNDHLPELPDSVPPAVRELVTGLAAKSAADRPADAAAVVSAIDGLGPSLELPQVTATDLPAIEEPADRVVATLATATLVRRRSRWATAGSAAAVALVVALLLAGEKSPSVAEAPEPSVDAEPVPVETVPAVPTVGTSSEPAAGTTPEPAVGTTSEPDVVAETAPEAPAPGPNPNANDSATSNGNGGGNVNANGNANGNGQAKPK
ncbi:serine/threonine-protein kinase [Aeromicrobium sp. Sec7.5]|uniref:serine/threonine-protein kinase n=1 Tax=Aeromicrobium sp. Sec7.5 TaxID=3121276 RepID=UPI002FE4D46A